MKKRYLSLWAATFSVLGAKLAMATATTTALPYSAGLGILKTSVTGEVSFVLAIICIMGAGAAYLAGHGQMDSLFMKVMGVLIVVCVITGSAAFMTSVSATGAMIG